MANRQKEGTLKAKQQLIAKYEEQRNRATTCKEYDTLQAEIASAREGCRRIEDEAAESPINAATQEMLKEKIDSVLKTLTYREREIIKLRYGLGDGYTYTLEEVGRIFKVTRERVRQIEAKAVRKLQHPVRARKLQGFLDL